MSKFGNLFSKGLSGSVSILSISLYIPLSGREVVFKLGGSIGRSAAEKCRLQG